MRSKVNDGSNFENRTLDRIYAIKAKVDSNPNVTYKEFGNNCSATNKCFYTLRKIDVILRSGSRKKPEYHWNNKFNVNTRLANKVASLIREDERKKYPASKASKMLMIVSAAEDSAVGPKATSGNPVSPTHSVVNVESRSSSPSQSISSSSSSDLDDIP